MASLLNFTIGFLAALVGVVPPGLLNLSAAKISAAESRKNGILFSVGVSITVMAQTLVALLLARYLGNHPEYVAMLKQVGLGIFICLTIYFFFIAKDTRHPRAGVAPRSKTNRFFAGMLLAFLNLLPLPYWVYISITFAGFGWFSFEMAPLWTAVFASGLGTFAMLAVYVHFFRRKKKDRPQRFNINYIIG
ncbi:MAG: LysE family transporter, partial [Marinirhabdus sp.]